MEEKNPYLNEPNEADESEQAPAQVEPEPTEEEQEAEEQHAADQLAENLAGMQQPPASEQGHAAQAGEWEKRFNTAEKRFATYHRQITALWGEDAEHLFPLSISPSAPPGFIDRRDAGRVDEETKAAVMEFLGFPREQEYEPDPHAHTCGTCAGKGRTSTGSKIASEASRFCPKCGGRGWVQPGATNENGNTATNVMTWPSDQPEREPVAAGERDAWGEPRILPNGERNENYGLMPQYKKPHPTYGVTAVLGAELTG